MEFTRVEYPIRGIHVNGLSREILDVQTGKVLESFEVSKRHKAGVKEVKILCVLDGDHVITDDYWVFSLAEKQKIQNLTEMRELYGRFGVEFTSLPAPKDYVYVYEGHSHAVFDPDYAVKKLVTYSRPGHMVGVWTWSEKWLKKDYIHDFGDPRKFEVKGEIFGLPRAAQILGEGEIEIKFRDSFAVFSTQERKVIKSFSTT